MQNIFLRFTKR